MPVLGGSPLATGYQMPTHTTTGTAPVDAGIAQVVDGTPVRVVVLAFSAAAGLMALKLAGFKFNVGVSA